MIYVIFEVLIKEDYMDKYLELAAELKDKLMENEGFIRSERFFSLQEQRKLLSLSVWENEQELSKWRKQMDHRLGQKRGREEIFESYIITVASKIRSYTDKDRKEAPKDSNQVFGLDNKV